jgi:23S rRNA (guanosine2251-2'-O)-methyltransferase
MSDRNRNRCYFENSWLVFLFHRKGESKISKKEPYFIPGYHSVKEALEGGKQSIRELWIAEGKMSDRIREVLRLAERKNIPVYSKSPEAFSRFMPDMVHQRISALADHFVYHNVDDLFDMTDKMKNEGFIVAADHITDEGNLGSIIRTSDFFGAVGVIIPKDRSAEVTPRVVKRSSGASLRLPIVRIVNMGRTLRTFKEKGFWIIGTSGNAHKSIWQFDWRRNIILVLGNEEKGLGPGVSKICHEMVKIPRYGSAESLNVAVACGTILSEIQRQRNCSPC